MAALHLGGIALPRSGSVKRDRETQAVSSPRHAGQETSASFLYSAARSLFEEAGFSFVRPKGTKNCVMRTTVSPC
jgi:hypothetical protein